MSRPNDLLRFSLVIPKGKKLVGIDKAKTPIPNGVKLDFQRTRDGSVASVNVDGKGLVFINPDRVNDEWLTPINRHALMWAEAKRCGGKYANQAYTQENASKPFHADSMWYEKVK